MKLALEDQCYGGKMQDSIEAIDDPSLREYYVGIGAGEASSTSAYMLVYERKMKTKIGLYFDSIEQAKEQLAELKIDPEGPIRSYHEANRSKNAMSNVDG